MSSLVLIILNPAFLVRNDVLSQWAGIKISNFSSSEALLQQQIMSVDLDSYIEVLATIPFLVSLSSSILGHSKSTVMVFDYVLSEIFWRSDKALSTCTTGGSRCLLGSLHILRLRLHRRRSHRRREYLHACAPRSLHDILQHCLHPFGRHSEAT